MPLEGRTSYPIANADGEASGRSAIQPTSRLGHPWSKGLPTIRPEGAVTDQPRAERSGESRVAPPWVRGQKGNQALKGRHRGEVPDVSPLQGLAHVGTSIPRATLPLVALPWAGLSLPLRGR